MYEKGDFIIYGSSGVCEIKDICVPEFIKGNDKMYYKLSHYSSTETIYAPLDTPVFMRPVISKREAESLIKAIPKIEHQEYASGNTKELTDSYTATIKTYDCKNLVQLIKTLYANNQIAIENGKTMRQTDQRFMKIAEEYLYGELSVALKIPRENVKSYIEEFLNCNKN